jgi:hypothetical protein
MAAANALITWNKLQLVKRGQRKVRSPGDPPEINVSLLARKKGRIINVACLYRPAVFWIQFRIRTKLKGRIRIRINVISRIWIPIRIKKINWIRTRIRINLQMTS